MKTQFKFTKFIIFIITLVFILANGIQASAFQNAGSHYDIFKTAPAKPAKEIVEMLGRYVNIKNEKDTFLIFEESGEIKMLRDKENPAFILGNIEYWNLNNSTNETKIFKIMVNGKINNLSIFKSGNFNKFYCRFNEKTYKQVIYGGENGGTYKIKPLKSINELRKAAVSAKPPRESDATAECYLVNLREIGGNMKFDIRYATDNNFMGEKFYETPDAFLQKPAAYAILYVANSLSRYGLGIMVYDAYRPWYVTKMFYDATPDAQKNFVADPSKGSRHNRGTAVDIGLYDLRTGELIDMGSGYDEFSERALPAYPGSTSYSRWHRKLLEYYMNKAGFTVYEDEWWHFDYKLNTVKYPLINKTFEQIKTGK